MDKNSNQEYSKKDLTELTDSAKASLGDAVTKLSQFENKKGKKSIRHFNGQTNVRL